MRIPSVPYEPEFPTLGQLRERLKRARATPWGAQRLTETETVADRMELLIAEREVAAGLRPQPNGREPWTRA